MEVFRRGAARAADPAEFLPRPHGVPLRDGDSSQMSIPGPVAVRVL